ESFISYIKMGQKRTCTGPLANELSCGLISIRNRVALGGAGAIMFLSDRSGLIGASSDQLITGYKDCAGCGLWNAVDFIRGQTKKEEDELTLAGNKTYWATLQKKNQSCNAPEVRFC
ncbi:hypothetical protein U9M48_010125, partial [Paspalum notatum var. saurae]